MRNRFHFISLAVVMFFGLETLAAADTFRIRLTGARCADDPACHNRFHPAIKPVVTVKPGDTVTMETRDAFDGQITPSSTAADVIPTFLGGPLNLNQVHPLTGPVAIQGAEPGDLLVVHIVDIIQDDFAYTVNVPGFGFLRSEVPGPASMRSPRWGRRESHCPLPRPMRSLTASTSLPDVAGSCWSQTRTTRYR